MASCSTVTTTNNATSTTTPRIYLLLLNPKKSNNLGPILRCAAAFGVYEVVLVGFAKCSVEGSHGASKYVVITAFPTVDKAIAYLKGRNDCNCQQIVGILGGVANSYGDNDDDDEHDDHSGFVVLEDDMSQSVKVCVKENSMMDLQYHNNNNNHNNHHHLRSSPMDAHPFQKNNGGGNYCFVMDKKCDGLSSTLANQCNAFVHIPHNMSSSSLSAAATAQTQQLLLDGPACLSIVLYHFTSWAGGYHERNFVGHKFELQQKETKEATNSTATREERAKQRNQQEQDARESIGDGGLLFESELVGDY